jgi:hypothetical protein
MGTPTNTIHGTKTRVNIKVIIGKGKIDNKSPKKNKNKVMDG